MSKPEFIVHNRSNSNRPSSLVSATASVYLNTGYINLNPKAKDLMGVELGDKVDVLQLDRTWYIAKSGEHGFKLHRTGSDYRKSLKACARSTVRKLFESMKLQNKTAAFFLQKTEHMHEGNPVFELLPIPGRV